MLDINRILNDQGRINLLTVSINTMKEIKIKGVPRGTKWEKHLLLKLNQPKIRKASQRGNPKLTEKTKCAEQEKM